VYLVGAITEWVRLTTANYPGDVALNLMPKSQIAALGLRGVLVVGLLLVPTVLVALRYLTRRASGKGFALGSRNLWGLGLIIVVAISSRFGWKAPVMVASLFLVGAATVTVGNALEKKADLKGWLLRSLVGQVIGALVLSALVSWRGLGVTFALLAGIGLVLALRSRPSSPGLRRVLVGGLIALEGVGALAWQIQSPVHITQVLLSPTLIPERPNLGMPYFGATDSFVYVGEVFPNPSGSKKDFRYSGQILEIPRKSITRLTFRGWPSELYPKLASPAGAIWGRVKSLWKRIF
jgi:hypothetical protein